MHIRSWLTVGFVLLLPPLCVGSCKIHDELIASRFERVAVGMRHAEVVSVMGAPANVQNCATPGPFRPDKWTLPDCAETYLYPSWGPLDMWSVWFNANGTVIDKYHFFGW